MVHPTGFPDGLTVQHETGVKDDSGALGQSELEVRVAAN